MAMSENNVHSAEIAINANLDRGLGGTKINSHLNDLAEQQKVFIAQLDLAVKRVLEMRCRLVLL